MPDIQTKTFTGAKIIVETLKKLGVDTIFGYPGSVVLNIYDELSKQNDIKHYLVRHEQAAVHAAEGYARVSGKCGVVLVTSGPGATNTVTGIVNAHLDGYPLVILTGQVMSNLLGKDAFQEADICDMVKSCTKKAFKIISAEELEETVLSAFELAQSGKKGPVLIDISTNVLTELTKYKNLSNTVQQTNPVLGDYSLALKELIDAKKPVIVAGGGVIHAEAAKELFDFVELLDIPVVDTMMGLGTFPQYNPKYAGMIGLYGDFSANQILKESDLIFAIGSRFNDRVTSSFTNGDLNKKVIHIDINKKEFSKNISAFIRLCGDAKVVLNLMINEFNSCGYIVDKKLRQNWQDEVNLLKSKNVKSVKKSDKLHSFEVMSVLDEFIKNNPLIITTEVGQHQLAAIRNLRINEPRKFITSGGTGTMGFGFPAAIGACVASGFQPVICIAGDGSIQMNIQELAVCADYKLPLKIFILNNGYLGMVRQLQEKMCDGRYSATKIFNPDFVKLAESYGLTGIRVTQKEDIELALKKAFDVNGTVIVDFVVEPLETV